MDNEPQLLSDRFRIILAQENIKQSDFSEATGYDSRKVSNIIRGTTKVPGVDLIKVIIEHYPHWNIRWLLNGEGEMFMTKGDVSYVGSVNWLKDLDKDTNLLAEIAKLRMEVEQLKKWLADKDEIIAFLKGKLAE